MSHRSNLICYKQINIATGALMREGSKIGKIEGGFRGGRKGVLTLLVED
jgi:hypothetical protein